MAFKASSSLPPPRVDRPKRPVVEPHFEGRWVKPSQGYTMPEGANKFCVMTVGISAEDFTKKVTALQAEGIEPIIRVHSDKDGQEDPKYKGKIIQPRLMTPMEIDRHGIDTEGKPYVVSSVELPLYDRQRIEEREKAELAKADVIRAKYAKKAPAQSAEEEAAF